MSNLYENWHWPSLSGLMPSLSGLMASLSGVMPSNAEVRHLIWKTLIFGVLSAACIGFFAVKLLSIHFDNLTWNPGLAGPMGILAILPIILASSLAWSARENWNRSQRQTGQAQPLLPPAQPLAQRVDRVPQYFAWAGIILTILGCFGFVLAYLRCIAEQDFHVFEWVTEVCPEKGFNAPSFGIFHGENDSAYANFSISIPQKCYYPAYNLKNCAPSFTSVSTFHSEVYGDLSGYLFHGSDVFLENPSSKVLLQTFVNYNSKAISGGYGDTQAPQNPYLYFVIFDSAWSLTMFQDALDCGIIALSEMPALGSTTLGIDPYEVKDSDLKALSFANSTCRYLYDTPEPPLFFKSQLASTGVLNSVACDTSSANYDSNHDCISQVIIRYETTYLTKYSSRRKKESNDILIDIGGIVGGVSFICWFFGIFAV